MIVSLSLFMNFWNSSIFTLLSIIAYIVCYIISSIIVIYVNICNFFYDLFFFIFNSLSKEKLELLICENLKHLN